MTQTNDTILQVNDLQTSFFTESGEIRALSGVNFTLKRGEVLGIVGESGCGKSVTAQCIMNMVPNPGKIMGGEIIYHRRSGGQVDAVDIVQQNPRGRVMRSVRGNEIAMIFQEPMTSLDPVYTVGSQLSEAITLHQNVSKRVAREVGVEALAKVHLPEPQRIFDSYPHQLSGGQRQRVMIAIALSCNPTLLIADEPTTALDVTTQAQILDLMQELQEETNMSIIFITHDLGVVAEMCDSVAVMYLGKVVEKRDVDAIFYDPKHPYTQSLLRSIPRLDSETHDRLAVIKGNVPDPSVVPLGCPFHPRCPDFMPGFCNGVVPSMIPLDDGGEVRCLLYDEEHRRTEQPVMA
ncbi:MAG: ABC transporter ATP-binding protein [Caldilineaceae bacterium]|nr:ABC transporter ATP-binding protein [Caldilineaceae bacterium]